VYILSEAKDQPRRRRVGMSGARPEGQAAWRHGWRFAALSV